MGEKILPNKPRIGADNIIINPKGEILLIKRDDQSKSFPGYWGLVGGFMQAGETIHDTLIREAKEEIGVDIQVIKFVGRYYDSPDRHPGLTVVCLPHISRIISGTPKPMSEVQDVARFAPADIQSMDLAYDHEQILSDAGFI